MVKPGRCQAQQMVKVQLPGGGIQQVSPPHHLRDAHGGVVHHHSQLIGKHPVRPPQQKITAVRRQIFLIPAHVAVRKAPSLVRHDQPQRWRAETAFLCDLRRRQMPAGSGIDHLPVLPVRGGGRVQLRAGAETGIDQPHPLQFFQRRLIDGGAPALLIGAGAAVLSGADVPVQSQPAEVRFHLRRVPPGTPGGVQVLHPQQDPSALLPGGEPHQQGAQEIAQMKPPAGGRRKAACGFHGVPPSGHKSPI